MLSRVALVLLVSGLWASQAVAQDPGPTYTQGTSFATIGRPPVPTVLGGRLCDRVTDKLDRFSCCGYGKTLNDMGVPGYRSSISFYWGSACEYFSEPCRRTTANTDTRNRSNKGLWNEMFGPNGEGCSSCGK